jgi:hypothetical protein
LSEEEEKSKKSTQKEEPEPEKKKSEGGNMLFDENGSPRPDGWLGLLIGLAVGIAFVRS